MSAASETTSDVGQDFFLPPTYYLSRTSTPAMPPRPNETKQKGSLSRCSAPRPRMYVSGGGVARTGSRAAGSGKLGRALNPGLTLSSTSQGRVTLTCGNHAAASRLSRLAVEDPDFLSTRSLEVANVDKCPTIGHVGNLMRCHPGIMPGSMSCCRE